MLLCFSITGSSKGRTEAFEAFNLGSIPSPVAMNKLLDSNILNTILKIVTPLAVLSYILGFIIQNIYLSEFGFSDYSFLQVKYISTGILFLSINVSVAFFIYNKIYRPYILSENKLKEVVLIIIKTIFFYIVLNLLFALLIRSDLSIYSTKGLPTGIFRLDSGIFLFLNFILSYLIYKTFQKNVHKNFLENIVGNIKDYGYIMYLLITLTLNLIYFSFILYPSFPLFVGGGRASTAFIETNDKDREYTLIIYQTSDYILTRQGVSTTSIYTYTKLIPFREIKSIVYTNIYFDQGKENFYDVKNSLHEFIAK